MLPASRSNNATRQTSIYINVHALTTPTLSFSLVSPHLIALPRKRRRFKARCALYNTKSPTAATQFWVQRGLCCAKAFETATAAVNSCGATHGHQGMGITVNRVTLSTCIRIPGKVLFLLLAVNAMLQIVVVVLFFRFVSLHTYFLVVWHTSYACFLLRATTSSIYHLYSRLILALSFCASVSPNHAGISRVFPKHTIAKI